MRFNLRARHSSRNFAAETGKKLHEVDAFGYSGCITSPHYRVPTNVWRISFGRRRRRHRCGWQNSMHVGEVWQTGVEQKKMRPEGGLGDDLNHPLEIFSKKWQIIKIWKELQQPRSYKPLCLLIFLFTLQQLR